MSGWTSFLSQLTRPDPGYNCSCLLSPDSCQWPSHSFKGKEIWIPYCVSSPDPTAYIFQWYCFSGGWMAHPWTTRLDTVTLALSCRKRKDLCYSEKQALGVTSKLRSHTALCFHTGACRLLLQCQQAMKLPDQLSSACLSVVLPFLCQFCSLPPSFFSSFCHFCLWIRWAACPMRMGST